MRHEITQWGHEAWVGPDGVHFSDYGCLEEVARTAPHDCDVPGCPGPVNKRKLEAFDSLLAALEAIQGDFVGHWIGCPARKLKPFTNEPVGMCPGTKDVCPTRWKRNQIKAAIAKATTQAR